MNTTAPSVARLNHVVCPAWRLSLLALALASASVPAVAQNFPITPAQKATAQQVAQAGVPLDELATDAPDSYTVKSGDTLWGISGLFLKRPWRWPELWGMNLQEIQNPHRIFPGQQLFLEKDGGRARLRTTRSGDEGVGNAGNGGMATVRVSPRTRYESLAEAALPTLKNQIIEPFLAEPMIVDEAALSKAPRIVSAQEGRVLLSKGDRAYALGDVSTPLVEVPGQSKTYRIFRNVTPLKDPETAVVLGYEAQYVGKAMLVHGQTGREIVGKDGKPQLDIVPASIDIVGSKEEMRVGDRLLPEPPRTIANYVPRAPDGPMDGRIVSVYGSAVRNAAQNQIVVINKGTRDGLQVGHVLAMLKDGPRVIDRTTGTPVEIKLPNERNGLVMVFRPFETLSYGLILQITDGAKVGDRVASPRP
jgi:nucleoid-associated protein YgaU